MREIIKELIASHDTIIIHRHTRPDMDAIGSQIGLYEGIKANYPNKNVYVVGDINDMSYHAVMDTIDDDVFQGALSIIVDVAVKHLISDHRYELAKSRIIIDHHKNATDVEDVACFYHEPLYTSACEIVVDLFQGFGWKVTPKAATYLYAGMVTDTGRFQFISSENASRVFGFASFITSFKPDIQDLYQFLYTESLAKREVKNMFSSFKTTEHGVAYRVNTAEMIQQSGLDIQAISRGMVNLMAGIKEIPIWASFTEDFENGKILAEMRSRGIVIVDIAKKYGGGGHDQACGASIGFEDIENMIRDLDERIIENEKNIR